MRKYFFAPIILILLVLSGCGVQHVAPIPEEPVQKIVTPVDEGLVCVAKKARINFPAYPLAVGDITNTADVVKYTEDGTGPMFFRGGREMASSILVTSGFYVVERVDNGPMIFEANAAARQLMEGGGQYKFKPPDTGKGDGQVVYVQKPTSQMKQGVVYFTGTSPTAADPGNSGGIKVSVAGIGGGYRRFSLNVPVDLRLVDKYTGEVMVAVSIQQLVLGDEASLELAKFFGHTYAEAEAGVLRRQMMHQILRKVLAVAVFQLTAPVFDAEECYAEIDPLIRVHIGKPWVFKRMADVKSPVVPQPSPAPAAAVSQPASAPVVEPPIPAPAPVQPVAKKVVVPPKPPRPAPQQFRQEVFVVPYQACCPDPQAIADLKAKLEKESGTRMVKILGTSSPSEIGTDAPAQRVARAVMFAGVFSKYSRNASVGAASEESLKILHANPEYRISGVVVYIAIPVKGGEK